MDDILIDLNEPAAIAFSGGGDSTALLHKLSTHPNVSHAFIIDHGLRDGSHAEVAKAAEIAKANGYVVQTKRWDHEEILTGIQAKARDYRYQALGDLCRRAGLRHLITAHTADDQAETLLMRIDRQTGWRGLAGMPSLAYGPLWPALADINLHRPCLGMSRQDLRRYNAIHNLDFMDDPSNQNTDFARIRARQALAADPALRADLLSQQKQMGIRLTQERAAHKNWLQAHAVISPQGHIETDAVPPSELLLHILNAVSGRGGPIDEVKRNRLCKDMESGGFKAATLGGAWILRQSQNGGKTRDQNFVFLRDRVAVTGRENISRLTPIVLQSHIPTVWDGRFLCQAKQEDVRVELASGHLQKLRQLPEFKSLFDLPREVRESLPLFFYGDRAIGYGACDTKYVTSRATSALRLQALK